VKEIDDIAPGRGHSYVVDVTDAALVTKTAAQVESEVGPVDVLILNAGVINGKLIEELTESEIRKTFDVNVLGLYWATKAFLPTMKKRRSGHIVTIASAAGLLGVVRQVDYSATKHAAVGFGESLRVELNRYAPDLRTTLVCPYYINTGMFDGVKSKVGWLLPILEEQDVADKVISAVERDKPELFMPWSVATLPFLRGLPSKFFDRAMDFLGVHASMDEFHGRVEAEKEKAN
jgi:all-trans-retinol dehydrogenase (NAD+)